MGSGQNRGIALKVVRGTEIMWIQAERISKTEERAPEVWNLEIVTQGCNGFVGGVIDRTASAIHRNGAGMQRSCSEADILLGG